MVKQGGLKIKDSMTGRERLTKTFKGGKVKPRGNWILSCSDFFFDGTSYENIFAFTEAGIEFGQY